MAMVIDQRRAMRTLVALCLFAGASAHAQNYYGADGNQPKLVSDWPAEQERRAKALSDYLREKPVAYRWFTDFPFGITSGAPYIVLKLLPRIAPEQWGSKDNFLDVVGLFNDERNAGSPIARGFGWTGFTRDDPNGAVDFAALSCGACHIGRVKLDDGKIRYLDGGVNTQFNLVQYRVRVVNTIKKMTGDAATPEDKVRRATAAVLAALDKAHAEDKNFFYRDYAFGARKFDAAYEANQIELFKKSAPDIVQKFLQRAELELISLVELINKNYKGFEAPMTQGFGGMADATGVSTSFAFAAAQAQGADARSGNEFTADRGHYGFYGGLGAGETLGALVAGSFSAGGWRRAVERKHSHSNLPQSCGRADRGTRRRHRYSRRRLR